jgi:hypothetical protein
MKIFVKVKPNAKHASVEKLDETHYAVAVKEPPVEGKANAAVAKALAEHLGVPASRVRLVSGHTSRQKVFEIFS